MPARPTTDLRRLLSAYGDDIERIVRLYADGEMDRADLRQEIAIALWQAMPRFLGESSERTYVVRVARNRAVTFCLRAARNRALFHPLDVEPAAPEHSGEHEVERLHARVREAMARLPERQHELLELSAAGYTPTQIASHTGRSAGAVRVALHRARAAVRAWLRGEESR